MDKLHDYQGVPGRFNEMRDKIAERIQTFRDNNLNSVFDLVKNSTKNQFTGNTRADEDFSHLHRSKSRLELVRVSAAVMGIEFSYAAETAFVSPTLLKIGVDHQHMTLIWALSPLVGFFLCPILGSMSDRCNLNMGRRRPFIIILSIGVFLGLLLVPNGETIGYWFGDFDSSITNSNQTHNAFNAAIKNDVSGKSKIIERGSHFWGIFFTVLGTVLLDFDADACQSPARAYLLDVCEPEDHAKGLSTFTIMAGLGGFMGYSMGGINWDATTFGRLLGGHVRTVFTIITVIFIVCVGYTITSFKEMPLWVLRESANQEAMKTEISNLNYDTTHYGMLDESRPNIENGEEVLNMEETTKSLGDTFTEEGNDFSKDNSNDFLENNVDPSFTLKSKDKASNEKTIMHYLLSIINMPHSLRMVCLTNLFCWMAHVCYSLYFTDFVGEAVFEGDPKARDGNAAQIRYEKGIRFGCWGMAMYSLSCACYSFIIEKLIEKFKAKHVYIGGLLFYSTGMTLMALTRTKASVIIFSWSAGVMYSTLFTMPYLLVAHYHSMNIFELDSNNTDEVRGLGTDIAIVNSMVFLAQFILSICMGTIVSVCGTTTAVVGTASFLSFCGAFSANKIMYLDL